jgi:hypothetical protein
MNSLVDQYDERRFGPMGQVVGVNYGGSVHQPTVTYSNIPQRLPDPGPRYGESRPPVIFDNTNPFKRAPRYDGGFTIPGAAGNLAGSLLGQMPQFIRGQYAPQNAILKVPHLDSPYIDEQIRRGFVPMTPPVRRSGPQLPGFV